MDDKSKIIARVQKLLALAGNNPSEEEASLAMAKAQAILAEHNLSMDAVQQKAETPEELRVLFRGEPWVRRIFAATASLYFCDYLYSQWHGKTVHMIIGRPHNAAVAQSMAEYLVTTVLKLSRKAARTQREDAPGRFKVGFREGAADRLWVRMRDMRQATESGDAQAAIKPLLDYKRQEFANARPTPGFWEQLFANASLEDILEAFRAGHHTVESAEAAALDRLAASAEVKNLPAVASLYKTETEANKAFIAAQYPKLGKGRTSRGASSGAGYRSGKAAADRISLNPQIGGKK